MHELLLAVFVLVVLRCLCASIETFVSMSRKTVAVVRCKDCAVPHNRWTGCPKMNGTVMPPDGFCSYGERKE